MRLLFTLLLLLLVSCGQTVSEQTVAGNVVMVGSFMGADAIHRGSGKVSVIAQNTAHTLRLEEDFSVTAGPDLFVWLTKTGGTRAGHLELGRLKGSQGSQNYAIPAGTNLSEYQTVVIWCKAFGVLFASADLVVPK